MKPNVRLVLDIVKLVGKGFGTMKGFAVYTLHTVLGLPKYRNLPVGSKLKPVTFNKITDEVVNENIHTGFIAQDILELGIPNLVMGSDESGYGLDYNGILALAVKAIQELKAEIEELKNK